MVTSRPAPNEHDELVKRGANARAFGRSKLDNPFLASDATPGATGETVEQWQAKIDAWSIGWQVEDAIRRGL